MHVLLTIDHVSYVDMIMFIPCETPWYTMYDEHKWNTMNIYVGEIGNLYHDKYGALMCIISLNHVF